MPYVSDVVFKRKLVFLPERENKCSILQVERNLRNGDHRTIRLNSSWILGPAAGRGPRPAVPHEGGGAGFGQKLKARRHPCEALSVGGPGESERTQREQRPPHCHLLSNLSKGTVLEASEISKVDVGVSPHESELPRTFVGISREGPKTGGSHCPPQA